MNLGEIAADLRRDEGIRLKPYRCTAGRLSIGVGRNLDDVGISPAEAETLLANDIARAAAGLDGALPWWRDLSAGRRRALVNMAFNLGLPGLLNFRGMLGALRAGDFGRAADEALDSLWARQVGARAGRVAALLREG